MLIIGFVSALCFASQELKSAGDRRGLRTQQDLLSACAELATDGPMSLIRKWKTV